MSPTAPPSSPRHNTRDPQGLSWGIAAVEYLYGNVGLDEQDLAGWHFAPSHNERQCVQVSLELGTLCRLLTCPCSQDERDEYHCKDPFAVYDQNGKRLS